ncbi:MAG TPA: hypothetical protein VGM89_09440 [Puia sp.]|jgi:hypothetical protein
MLAWQVWYFFDNGIRNALINNFSPLQSRNDIGQLWEQYVLSERMTGRKSICWKLDNKQHLQAFECKWQDKKVKPPAAFAKAYPEADFTSFQSICWYKTKQDTHAGGNTDPLINSWPAKIKDTGTMRRQYHHLTDIVPTLLEVSHLPAPKRVNGVDQMPLPGVSMAYTFDHPEEHTHKKIQYYEMLGSRAIWVDGWKAVTWHKKGVSYDLTLDSSLNT